MKINFIKTDEYLKETTKHGTVHFPVEVYIDELAKYESGFIKWHWHSEIEFIIVLQGNVAFYTGGNKLILPQGEGAFINSNILHMAKPYASKDSVMCAILFDPVIVYGYEQSLLFKKYVNPILTNPDFDTIPLAANIAWQKKMLDMLLHIYNTYHSADYGYEFELKILLSQLWLELTKANREDIVQHINTSQDNERVKLSLQYIYDNYAAKISLQDISDAAKISKSECCRCFQRMLKTTPVEYLIKYRIYISTKLLEKSDDSISDIAAKTGFANSSHYSNFFSKIMNCMPSEYRKKHRNFTDL